MARIEAVRLEAGRRMGLGDVRDSVLPKPVLLAPGAQPMALRSRYFTPRSCHRSHAATGAVGVACAFSYRARWRMASAARSRPLAAVACASSIRRGDGYRGGAW